MKNPIYFTRIQAGGLPGLLKKSLFSSRYLGRLVGDAWSSAQSLLIKLKNRRYSQLAARALDDSSKKSLSSNHPARAGVPPRVAGTHPVEKTIISTSLAATRTSAEQFLDAD